jgi:hypothetical protein
LLDPTNLVAVGKTFYVRKYRCNVDAIMRARDKFHILSNVCLGIGFTIFHLFRYLFGVLAHRNYLVFHQGELSSHNMSISLTLL